MEENLNVPYQCKPRKAREVFTPIGINLIPENEYFVKDGVQCAKPGKGIVLDAYLLASQAQTDIALISAKLLAGDTSVINVRNDGVRGDFASMPKNINEVNQLGKNIKKIYSSLSAEVKSLFPTEKDFFESCINGSLKDKLSVKGDISKKISNDVKKSEVKKSEDKKSDVVMSEEKE